MRLAALGLAALLCAACGGGAAPAGAPSQTPSDTQGSDQAPEAPAQQPGYGTQPQKTEEGGEARGPHTGGFAQEPPMTLDEAVDSFDRAATELATAGADCVKACKALRSMERSSERICELNQPMDPGERCRKAKQRVDAAREALRSRCDNCET